MLGWSCGAPGGHLGCTESQGMAEGKREYRQVAGEYPGGGENVGQAAPRRQGKERKRAAGTATHLHDVELGQQVAISQRELVAVEEAALGGSEVGLTGQLMLQGCAQVLIQLQQGLQQVPLQCCGAAAVCSQGCRQPPASTVPAPLSPGLGWRCLCPPTARHGTARRAPQLLTLILSRHWVLDEGGELVKDVVSSQP